MKIKFTTSFQNRLLRQVEYIALDSPQRAREFQKELIKNIHQITDNPFMCRKSIYFDDNNIRDFIFKGYTIVYKINHEIIEVFGFVKYQNSIQD